MSLKWEKACVLIPRESEAGRGKGGGCPGAAGREGGGWPDPEGWVGGGGFKKMEKEQQRRGPGEQVCANSVLGPHRDWAGDTPTHGSFHGGLLQGTGVLCSFED